MTEAVENARAHLVAALHEKRHPANCNAIGDASPVASEDNPYLGDFSRRVAERLAGLPKRPALGSLESDDEPRISWKLLRRSYKLVLAVMAGAILYGGIVYPLLSELRSPRLATDAMAKAAPMSR